jgi:hypothetical protein
LPRIHRYSALDDISKLEDSQLLARCFLETKLYDHQSWPNFVLETSQSLLNVPENEWDEHWLRDLHLFNIVVRDASQCETHLPTAKLGINLSDFFKSLVNKQQESLSKLLSAYATQDAAAVFRLAEVCNLDIAKDFPEIIVSNCDQIPFFALLREQMLREQNRIQLWTSLLSESALQSRMVASLMHDMEPAEELNRHVQTVAKDKQWFCPGIVKKSFLTQCLSISMDSDSKITKPLNMINLIRKLRTPPSSKWEYRLLRLFPILSMIILAIFIIQFSGFIFKIFPSIDQSNNISRIFLVVMITLYPLLIYCSTKRRSIKHAYNSIIQHGTLSYVSPKTPYSFIFQLIVGRNPNVLGKRFRGAAEELIRLRKTSSFKI